MVKLQSAGETPGFIKIIVTGPLGSGKTRFGLDGGTFKINKDGTISGDGELWPDLIVVNAEGGTKAYEVPFRGMFRTITTRNITDLKELVEEIRDGRVKCGTLLIDTWTNFRDSVRAGQELKLKGADIGYREHAKVNKVLRDIQDILANVPCHVILVIHEKDVFTAGGPHSATSKTALGVESGLKLDANNTVGQWADIVLWFQKRVGRGTSAVCSKTRGINLGEDENLIIKNPSWKTTFKAVAELWAGGERGRVEPEAEAAVDALKDSERSDAPVKGEFEDTQAAKDWVAAWGEGDTSVGITELKKILGVELFKQCKLTFVEADKLVAEYVHDRNATLEALKTPMDLIEEIANAAESK